MSRESFLSKKNTMFFIGLFSLLLLLAEFFMAISQPVSNLGLGINFYEPDFFITKVVKNTPAYKAKILKNETYLSINGVTVEELVELRSKTNESEFKMLVSGFYQFGKKVTLENYNGDIYSFILEKLPLFQRLQSTSVFLKFKYCIGTLMILCGLAIILFLNTDRTTAPLVYSLFFLGITTANLFDTEFSSATYLNIANILLDFGLFFTFGAIFEYFSRIFTYSDFINPFKFLRFLPISIFLLKYIHLFFYKWHLSTNPFFNLTSVIVIICCIIFIAVFIFIIFCFPKNLTVTFKFFVIGLAYAVTPLLVEHFCYIATDSLFMTEPEKIYCTIAFISVPFMLILSILQSKNLIRSRNVSQITTYFAFLLVSIPIFLTLLNYIHQFTIEKLSLIYLLISPPILYVMYHTIKKFFSLNTKENEKKIDSYKNTITNITDTDLLHKVTSAEIEKNLQCSYIIIFKKNQNKNWDVVYTTGNVSEELSVLNLYNSQNKKRTSFYKDGSFSVPIIRDSEPFGIFYIGPKNNEDQYLPGDHLLIEQILSLFHRHYLMFTNNRLLGELKIKNDKLIKMQEDTILSMANLIESRDGGTGEHVKRTAEYSVLISKHAMEKGLFADIITPSYIKMLYKAAPMHDIGKIVVPDSVLKKPGKLSFEEFEIMKQHTTEGERIVREVLSSSEDEEYIKMASEISKYHHEKWNGNGYPSGLSGENIPLCARILAIADVFDALVSPRCYKEPMEPEKAFSIIKQDAGSHFDPVLAEVFLEFKDEALEIMRLSNS